MTDLGPNTHPGYCPVCSIKADIWNDTRNAWECAYCNWIGTTPDREPKLKREDYVNEIF